MKRCLSDQQTILRKYTHHCLEFMDGMKLWPRSGATVLVGLSGGADSVALLHLLMSLQKHRSFNLRAIHINHGLRSESLSEQEFATNLCNRFNIPLIVETATDLQLGDGEHGWRQERYRLFRQHLKKGDRLALGHHIDDSYEWAQMQRGKTTSLKATIGIPVINGAVIRPLMAFTRAHILRYLQLLQEDFVHDPSNDDGRFERNYWRKELIPPIAQKYPHYLKFYSHQARQLAGQLGLARQEMVTYPYFKDSLSSCLYLHPNGRNEFPGLQEQARQTIHYLSSRENGKVYQALQKFENMGRHGKRGPMDFSGGVKGIRYPGATLFYHESNKGLILSWESFWLKRLEDPISWQNEVLQWRKGQVLPPFGGLILTKKRLTKGTNLKTFPLLSSLPALAQQKFGGLYALCELQNRFPQQGLEDYLILGNMTADQITFVNS